MRFFKVFKSTTKVLGITALALRCTMGFIDDPYLQAAFAAAAIGFIVAGLCTYVCVLYLAKKCYQ